LARKQLLLLNNLNLKSIIKEWIMAVLTEKGNATQFSEFSKTIFESRYSMKDEEGNPTETWEDTAERVVTNVLEALGYDENSEEYKKLYYYVSTRKFIPGGRYLYAAGREFHQTQNCLLLKAEDSREGWSELLQKASMALMTGAGIGVDYSDIRPSGSLISKTGGTASGPVSLMEMLNESGRHIMHGGQRRSAIWAGLNWKHPDCEDFIKAKDWSPEVRELKEKDFNFPATLDMTNVSVILDDEFFEAFDNSNHPEHERAKHIYHIATKRMVKTAEPGFSIDTGENAGETLRNACTEVTSRDDSDICNLGSINMANISKLEEFKDVVKYATLFLLAGTVYSDLPYEKVYEVRQKNRRLGLGLMGIHEWLLKRGYGYGENEELAKWLTEYQESDSWAQDYSIQHGLTIPVKTRAIAPTGTIGLIAETTTGIEPIFCVAYKRRYLGQDKVWHHQYVVDPTARRLVENNGVNPEDIEDAYSLSYNVEKRIAFQAFVQQYVDHGISSTINLPYPITEENELEDFKSTLYKYLPQLRGVTCYPDGARGGQPLTPANFDEAMQKEGVVFESEEDNCVGGICGV
jgi:ribonucleoside-diphosphate reductase alpha chain